MDRSDLELLFTPEAVELLESLPPIDSKANVVRNVTALRKRGVSAEMTSVVLLQRRLRTIARAKFGEFADTMFFTENGLQQATRLAVAAHHAERFRGVSPFSPIVTCNLNVFGVHDRCVMPLNLQYMFNRPKGASLELTLLDGRNLAKAGIRVSG
jgi:hypothetical protein